MQQCPRSDRCHRADRRGERVPRRTRLLGTVIRASSDAQDWVTAQLNRDDTPIEETPIDNLTMGDLPTNATLTIPGDHEQADRTDDATDSKDQGPSDSDET